jgi:RNA-directed DNA polymerase
MLANAALNGIEELLQSNFRKKGHPDRIGKECDKVNLTRYADDFIITARTKEIAEKAKMLVKTYVAERGLQLSEEKTLVTNIYDGFDFLGWNFRKYHNGKLLIMPSKKSQQKVLQKIREVIYSNPSITQDILIAKLNPIIDGWSAYHQGAVSRKVFERIDHFTYLALWQWAKRRHPNKGLRWIKARYWKTVGNNHWVFMDTHTLRKMSDKKIIRHIALMLDRNPYLDHDYFYQRHLRLLMNRKFGYTPAAEKQYALTRTGKDSSSPCLYEA